MATGTAERGDEVPPFSVQHDVRGLHQGAGRRGSESAEWTEWAESTESAAATAAATAVGAEQDRGEEGGDVGVRSGNAIFEVTASVPNGRCAEIGAVGPSAVPPAPAGPACAVCADYGDSAE